MEKSMGELVDELSVTNIKIFMLVEKTQQKQATVSDGIRMDKLVQYRSQLKNAINEKIGDRQEIKVYGENTSNK